MTFDAGWIHTHSNHQVWPLEAAGTVTLIDIAHSLSHVCRFGGHTREFYSVAQHSVLASQLIAPEFAAWGLMHDAAEAYLGDITRPLKRCLWANLAQDEDAIHVYKHINQIEADLQQHIANVFGLTWPAPWCEIDPVDSALLHSERRVLLGPAPAEWGPKVEYPAVCIKPVSSKEAKQMFLARAKELGIQ